ncbi:hypothetical protein DPMN_109260 [Dreissena polymorpha]|uniref:Uncharacterized protein n=1 Tax=Dreissena polymorpha TaxID=45954 RepID=A0A9D4QMS0_DREPO|nr:hypothetical protein DPMN_109260 [Dreissena polymorpha]
MITIPIYSALEIPTPTLDSLMALTSWVASTISHQQTLCTTSTNAAIGMKGEKLKHASSTWEKSCPKMVPV